MADNIIDSLKVVLELDPSKYTAAQKKFLQGLHNTKEQAGKTAEQLEAKGAQGASFFDQMSSSALKLGAILVGGIGIKDLVKNAVAAGNATFYMSKNIGISAQQLNLWQNAIREVGGDANQVGPALLGLSQALTTISLRGLGSGDLIATFQALGIALTDPVTGRLKTVTELLPELHAALSKLSPQVAYNLGSAIGLTPDMINLLQQSDPLYQRYIDNAKALGQITQQQIAATRHLTQEWGLFEGAILLVGYELAGKIDPIINGTTELLGKLTGALVLFGDKYAASDIGALLGGIAGFAVGGPIGAAAGVVGGGLLGAALDKAGHTGTLATAGSPGGDGLFKLIQRLEGGSVSSVTPTGLPNDPYAYGRNQITLGTALRYDRQATAAKLLNGAYNDDIARRIEADYGARYHGNIDAIALAYHNGPGAADRFVRSGGSLAGLGPQSLAYLQRERALAAGAGGTTTTTTNIGTINVNAPNATDARGISAAIRGELANNQLISQGNAGPQ